MLSFANERARQPRGGSNEHASLERLEAENVQLRASVVELVLQIQALRDGARRLIAEATKSAGIITLSPTTRG